MRFRLTTLVWSGISYAITLVPIATSAPPLFVPAIAYTLITMAAMHLMLKRAEALQRPDQIDFYQSEPANSIGEEWGSFHHVFVSQTSVLEHFASALSNALAGNFKCAPLREISLRDLDKELASPETRRFLYGDIAATIRKTELSILCEISRTNQLLGVRWWILQRGQRDPNKVFSRYSGAPLVIPFVIFKFLRRQYNPLIGLNTIAPGFFNANELLHRSRQIQFVAFETLCTTLESFDIDTTDLRQQRGNLLNINVTGGQVTMGNLVQGVRNKVMQH